MIEEKITDVETNNNKSEEMEALFDDSETLLNMLNSKTQEEIMGLAADLRNNVKGNSKHKLNNIVHCKDKKPQKKNNYIGEWDTTKRNEIINFLIKTIKENNLKEKIHKHPLQETNEELNDLMFPSALRLLDSQKKINQYKEFINNNNAIKDTIKQEKQIYLLGNLFDIFEQKGWLNMRNSIHEKKENDTETISKMIKDMNERLNNDEPLGKTLMVQINAYSMDRFCNIPHYNEYKNLLRENKKLKEENEKYHMMMDKYFRKQIIS